MNDRSSVNTSAVARPLAFLGRITRSVRATATRLLQSQAANAPGDRPTRVLDVGCGNGLFFAETGPIGATRIGSDLDLQLLQEAGRIFQDNRVVGVSMVCANATHLPFATGSIDNILFLNILVNIPDDETVQALLSELARVCRPRGRLFVDIRNRSNFWLRARYRVHNLVADFVTRGYDLRQMTRLMESVGCRIQASHPIGRRFPLGPSAYLLEVERLTTSDSPGLVASQG